jgi:hypothetical protein
MNLASAGFDPRDISRTGTNGFWGPAAEKVVGPRASVPVHIATGTNALEY